LFYALLGGVGVVLFWRGIWHIADDISLNSILSLVIGSFILLITGVFVSAFVGNRLIISGLSGEKKLTEKTKEEIETEEDKIDRMQKTLNRMEQKIEEIDSEINHK
jgi:peptidoglycan hydrolase CwlO-like protein